MSKQRKYPKTEGYYVYYHQTPDKLVYFGMSKMQPNRRWKPSMYKFISLYSYIEKYGWNNIKHMVIQDGLTKDQALKIEDWLIRKAKADGFAINDRISSGWTKDESKRREYSLNYYYKHKNKCLEYRKIYDKRKSLTPSGKIYNRVHNYNIKHPDKKVITPLEAKEMYELTGYIPDFIKRSDLY